MSVEPYIDNETEEDYECDYLWPVNETWIWELLIN